MTRQLTEFSEGIYLAGTYSEWDVGAWILEAGGECALLEMPPPGEDGALAAAVLRRILDERGWICKYLLLSHPHWDHAATMDVYRKLFPEAAFAVHYSAPLFLRISDACWNSETEENPWLSYRSSPGGHWYFSLFDRVITEDTAELELGGEPLYLLYGPKHSLGDVHHIFKGVWFPGDWWLYEGDPCPDRAASSKAVDSLDRLSEFLRRKGYRIHSVFPSHANNILRDVSFEDIFRRTRAYHERYEREHDDGLDWKSFCIKAFYHYVFSDRDGA